MTDPGYGDCEGSFLACPTSAHKPATAVYRIYYGSEDVESREVLPKAVATTTIRLQFDHISTPIRLQFDRATTIRRPTLQP